MLRDRYGKCICREVVAGVFVVVEAISIKY